MTSFHQIGRSTESPIDFVVTDTVAGSQSNADTQSVQSTISRFACRIKCQRTPPYTARIYAAGFDSSKNIFLGVSWHFQMCMGESEKELSKNMRGWKNHRKVCCFVFYFLSS